MDIITTASLPLAGPFFAPMLALLPAARHQRVCELSDAAWLLLGTTRALDDQPSGRAFLQKSAATFSRIPVRTTFFDGLASKRRGLLTCEINLALTRYMTTLLPDPFAAFPELAAFDLSAGDGHFHTAAVHDPRDTDGKRHATGHVYLLNLRSQAMHHLDLCDPVTRRKEHDLHVLKRHDFDSLRSHAPKGRRVIMAYDRAILDYRFWQKAKDTAGLYFVSRPKCNTNLLRGGFTEYDHSAPVNAGILSDEQAAPEATAKVIRRITWQNPDDGAEWQFLTNEMTLPPGLIVLIYRRRWDIEKVFDEFKSKLHETKSWASSSAAKRAQANFLCLTHNLMVLYEHELAKSGITNIAEEKRRAGRLQDRTAAAVKEKRFLPTIISGFQRLTQRSVKFIRWLRGYLWSDRPLTHIHAILIRYYAAL